MKYESKQKAYAHETLYEYSGKQVYIHIWNAKSTTLTRPISRTIIFIYCMRHWFFLSFHPCHKYIYFFYQKKKKTKQHKYLCYSASFFSILTDDLFIGCFALILVVYFHFVCDDIYFFDLALNFVCYFIFVRLRSLL